MKFCFLNGVGEQTSDTLYRRVDVKQGQVLEPLNLGKNIYRCMRFNDYILGNFILALQDDFTSGLTVLNIASREIHSAVFFTQYEKLLLEKFFKKTT